MIRTPARTTGPEVRMVLIGCSKTKNAIEYDRRRGGRVFPLELYGGQLFKKRVQYAEARGLPWVVLSAEYGVWFPEHENRPYDAVLDDLNAAERTEWALRCALTLSMICFEPFENEGKDYHLAPSLVTFEIHAGQKYFSPLDEILRSAGFNVDVPTIGLGIGEQLREYTTGRLKPPALDVGV